MKNINNDDNFQINNLKRKSVYSLSRTYPAYLILILLLISSYFIYDTTKNNVATENKNQFEKSTKSVEIRLQNLLQSDLEILQSMRGLYDMLPTVVRDYFEIYATVPVKSHVSIKSIAYIPYINITQKPEYLYNTYSIGYYYYKIHPDGEREFYFPVQMVVPFDNYNNKLLGFDLATNSITKTAIEKARDENLIVSTPVFNFDLRNNDQTFFVLSPIYSKNSDISNSQDRVKNFVACLALEINSLNFFKEALAGAKSTKTANFPTDSNIIYKFYDLQGANKKVKIYESPNSHLLTQGYKPLLNSVVPFKIADREIALEFYTSPSFQNSMQSSLAYIALAISLLLSFALFGFILAIITSRGRALDLAERMTRSQRRILETTRDIIASMDFNGNWKSMNNASYYVFGYQKDEMLKMNFFDLVIDEKDKENLKSLIANPSSNEVISKLDIQMKKSDGNPIVMNWNLVISFIDKLIYAIGSDVTLEKKEEEESRLRSQQMRLASFFIQESAQAKSLYTIKTNHQLRNSLTSVLGYLQLLDQKLYDNQDEMYSYIKLAEQSSEEIYTYLSDIMDSTMSNENHSVLTLEDSSINLGNLLKEIESAFAQQSSNYGKIILNIPTEADSIIITSNLNYLKESLTDILASFSQNMNENEILLQFERDTIENSIQIQIISKPNQLTSEMINLYKENQDNLIDAIRYDKDDVLFRLAASASKIHTLNGQIVYDTLGINEDNIAIITLSIENIL